MKHLVLLIAVALSGCAGNPFETYYNHTASYEEITGSPLTGKSAPAIFKRDDSEEDSLSLVHSGHLPLGYSEFIGSSPSAAQAKAFGAELGADVVLLYSKYRNTEARSADIAMPSITTFSSTMTPGLITAYGTQNQTFSYNVDNHEFMAGYWVKAKPKRWGVFTRNITPSEFEKFKTNRGVFVRVTVKDSPAHQAGLMRGDILLQVNSEKVADQAGLEKILHGHENANDLNFYIMRNGEQRMFTLRAADS